MFTEFFCGIGGLSCCLSPTARATSIDINQNALAVHELNHGLHRRCCKTIESLTVEDLSDAPRQLWWMSPPCQPFTRRGLQRDLDDRRSAAFLNVLNLIEKLKPDNVGFENVPEFENSESDKRLRQMLVAAGYQFIACSIRPTELGSQNRRRRFYIAATRPGSNGEALEKRKLEPLAAVGGKLEANIDHQMFAMSTEWLDRYRTAIHVVEEQAFLDGSAVTNCFTSAYGRSPVHCGSYLQTSRGIRRFTPLEILWQLGFPDSFQLPAWPPEKLWPLTGNTLALPAVKFFLSHLSLPGLIPCP